MFVICEDDCQSDKSMSHSGVSHKRASQWDQSQEGQS